MPDQDERDADEDERLRRLGDRIAAARGQPRKARSDEHYSQAQAAWRMVTELVAGLGIGFAIGLGLDTLFGTTPFLMILFLGLGFAAGVKTMMRTATEVQTRGAAEAAGDDNGPGGASRTPTARDGTGAAGRDETGAAGHDAGEKEG